MREIGHFIGGKEVKGTSGRFGDVFDPNTGEVQARVAFAKHAEVEHAIVSHPKVAESAVIGQTDEETGQSIAAFVTLEGDLEGSDELQQEIREHVANRIGKLARPKRVIWANELPKTRSGKIMRRLLRDIAEGRELGDVTTLADPAVMDKLEEKIKERGEEE